MVSKLLKLYLFTVFFTLGTMSLYGSYSEINFSPPLLRKGLKHCLLGDKAEVIIGKPFKPSLVPGPNGEELIMKSITDRRFGFDSLHLGFTMESQQLCSLGFCRNFDYSTSDQEIYNVLTNVFEWVNATFQGSIERNKTFDLRTPSQSLYANVDTEMLELKIEASKRNDVPMAWVMISMKDKQLIHEASIEFDRVSNSPTLMRWLNRDPIGENGGNNLYSAFKNQPICYFDPIGLEVFVVWHMPGDDFLYKWSKPDSAAETYFRASKPFVERTPCGFGKIAYKVTLTPPVSMIDVYFRRYLSPQEYWFARKYEEEHIALYVAYDKCIEEFKRRVESICACPADAVKAKKEAEDWLEERASYYIYKNKFLDRKGGPHGH